MDTNRLTNNPYVGLRPFEADDSLYFFDRREQTTELLELLHQSPFLAVVGSSGCGKSSLIRAGLIPALLGGFLVEERDHWQIVTTKPGDAPLKNLAVSLATTLHPDAIEAQSEALYQAIVEHTLRRCSTTSTATSGPIPICCCSSISSKKFLVSEGVRTKNNSSS